MAFIAGCAAPSNLTGTWLTIHGSESCSDYTTRPISKMELHIERQDDHHDEQRFEYECDEGWFAISVSPGSYYVGITALITDTDSILGEIDHIAGSAPAVGIEVGDGDVVVSPFVVDVGRVVRP